MGFVNCTPDVMNLVNEHIQTHKHTFYFAYSTGDRMRSRTKQREVYNDPKKYVNSFFGYEINTKENIVLRN